MIIFTPYKNENVSPLSVDAIHNQMNIGMANKLSERFGERYCELHPEFVNECMVDLSDRDKGILKIESVCCNKFKPFLVLLSQNQDPDSPI